MTRFFAFAFLAVCLTTRIMKADSFVPPSGQKNFPNRPTSIVGFARNVCLLKEVTKKVIGRKRKVSRHCWQVTKNCENEDFPLLLCKENRCKIDIKWIPRIKTSKNDRVICCPGWGNGGNIHSFKKHHILTRGCTKPVSCITLPQHTPKRCWKERQLKLAKNRAIYSLTTPPENASEGKITEDNLLDFLTFPVLNLTSKQVVGLTVKNPNERGWAATYLGMSARNQKLVKNYLQSESFGPFHNFSDYAELLESFRNAQHNGRPTDQFFRYPSQEEKNFKNIIDDEVWQEDKVFAEQRLAGMNPMSLRKLSLQEYLKERSHYSSELGKAIERVTGVKTTMIELIKNGLIFVVDYPLIHELTNVPDILDRNSSDRREMRSSRSPVGVFVSVQNWLTKKYELKALSIQTDYNASAPVFTPEDGDKWLLAKEEIQRADLTHLQMVEHLLKTHLLMEPICATVKRTLSEFHPLYELLKWHCRGTFMVNSLGLPSLVKPGGFMHQLFAIGHEGAIELLNKAYNPETSWADTDFEKRLKERGVYDKEKLPYFPHRDDGIVIWRLMKRFAKEYVNLYYNVRYSRWFHGSQVAADHELQNFARELSSMGMIKDFPDRILTQNQLADILARIVFTPIRHHAVNYPVVYYGSFVPNMPSKLYDDPRVPPQEFGFHSLPQSHVAAVQVGLGMTLGSLRYDRLFDYSAQMKDKRAAKVVLKYYNHLMGPAEKVIRLRNKQRFKNGHLTYPYYIPGYMPNSIHT